MPSERFFIQIWPSFHLRSSKEVWVSEAFNCSQSYSWECSAATAQDTDNEVFEESSPEDVVTFFASDEEPDQAQERRPPHVGESADPDILFDSDEDAEPQSKRARYNSRKEDPAQFLGKPVCRRALAGLLAIGGSTLQKLRQGESAYTNNERKPLQKHPTFGFTLRGDTGKVWEHIVMFFFHVYHSAAEVLPTNWLDIKAKGSEIETPFPEDCPEADASAEELQRLVNAIGRTLNTFSTDVDCQLIGPGTFTGPRRCLQHGCRTDLYWEYLAYVESRSMTAASYNTFMRVANTILKPGLRDGHLRFRKPGEHSVCDFCFQAKERIRQARSKDAKLAEERELVRHRLSQWQDRQIYWAFRTMSQNFFCDLLPSGADPGALPNVSTLCVIIDGMDQAKFRTPRSRKKTIKLMATMFRPCLHVSACWAHGWALDLAIADEDLKKNSESVMEQVSRTLDNILREKNCLPTGVNLQADNTYRETKNQFVVAYAALTVALGCFRFWVCSFLRKGHSFSFCFQATFDKLWVNLFMPCSILILMLFVLEATKTLTNTFPK